MKNLKTLALLLVLAAWMSGCGDDSETTEPAQGSATDTAVTSSDVSVGTEVAQTDADDGGAAPISDAGSSPPDASVVDASVVDAGASLPQLPVGSSDSYAQTGCSLMAGTKTAPVAGATAAEAGQQIIVPSHQTGYAIALPESGIGYVTLEVPDWQVIIAFFSTPDVEMIIHDPESKTEVIQGLSWAAPCSSEQVTEHRTKFHKWGGFTVELRGEPGGEAWLAAVDLPLE